ASPTGIEATTTEQYRSLLGAIAILRPETIIRWHRAGFRSYWRERSRKPVGRPRISAELRNLICAMGRANHLWGAPHIHGELLKLGFTIAQSTGSREGTLNQVQRRSLRRTLCAFANSFSQLSQRPPRNRADANDRVLAGSAARRDRVRDRPIYRNR